MTNETQQPTDLYSAVVCTVSNWLEDGVDASALATYLSYASATIIINMPGQTPDSKRVMLAIIAENIKQYANIMLLEPTGRPN